MIWFSGGNIVVDGSGNVVICDDCPCAVQTDCCVESIPRELTATFQFEDGGTGIPTGTTATITLTWDAAGTYTFRTSGAAPGGTTQSYTGAWVGTVACGGETLKLELRCLDPHGFAADLFGFNFYADASLKHTGYFGSLTCDPFYVDVRFAPSADVTYTYFCGDTNATQVLLSVTV